MRPAMTTPIQKAEKFPAVRPARMLSEAPPSREAVTISLHVAGVHGGEDLHHLRDDRAGQRAAGDDGGELPPEGAVAEVGDEEPGDEVGEDDRQARGEPHEERERVLEVHLVGVLVARPGEDLVQEVAADAGQHHHDSHGEDPDEQLHLRAGVGDRQHDEGDEGHAGDAVGLEAVGGRAHRVAGIVADAVGDDAGVAGVVLLDLEDDLHEVRADVGDLGEDAAGDAERRGAERLPDGEADEAGPGQVPRHPQQDAEHDDELGGDEHGADAHAGRQRDGVGRVGLAAERGEGGAAVGVGVHPHAEPGDSRGAQDADEAEEEDDDDPAEAQAPRAVGGVGQEAVVAHDDDGDEGPQQRDEPGLRLEVGLAGLVDELGDVPHGAVHRQLLEARRLRQAEGQAGDRHQDADGEERAALHAQEGHRVQVGQHEARLAPVGRGGGEGEFRGEGMKDHGQTLPPAELGFELQNARLRSRLRGKPANADGG